MELLSPEVRQPAGCDWPEVESQRLVISVDAAVCSRASLDTQYVGSIVGEERGGTGGRGGFCIFNRRCDREKE